MWRLNNQSLGALSNDGLFVDYVELLLLYKVEPFSFKMLKKHAIIFYKIR